MTGDLRVGGHVLWYERGRPDERWYPGGEGPGAVWSRRWHRRAALVVRLDDARVHAVDAAGVEHVVCRWHVEAAGTPAELERHAAELRRQLHTWELHVAEQEGLVPLDRVPPVPDWMRG